MEERKEYKAYPGVIGYLIIFPFLLPYLVAIAVIFKALLSGSINKALIGYIFAIALLAMPFCLLTLAIVAFTSLVLDSEGITYNGVKLGQAWNLLKAKRHEVKSPWNSVREIRWLGSDHRKLYIKTGHGDIQFGVTMRRKANEEIMKEILRRTPHLQNI
jgi:hypothetical protein